MNDFVQAARSFCGAALDAAALPLEQRVEILGDTLGLVVLAGRALPPVAAPERPPGPGPAADGWPGLGSFEDVWRSGSPLQPETPELVQLSQLVLEVERWLWAGLEAMDRGELDLAAGWWAGGWPIWGTEALVALTALHHAGLRFRIVPRARRAASTPQVVPLSSGSSSPTLLAAPAESPPPGVLGVRFEPLGVGALVREVHPASPAAGVLLPGDVLLSAGAHTLVDIDPEQLRSRLVAPVGRTLGCEVYRDGDLFEVELVLADPSSLTP